MRRILALCGAFPLVWLQFFDGEVRLVRACKTTFGDWTARLGGNNRVTLLPGGRFRVPEHPLHAIGFKTAFPITSWKEWGHNRKHILFEDDPVSRALKSIEDAEAKEKRQ